jgi:hypothetical protein
MQWHGKHFSAAVNKHAVTEETWKQARTNGIGSQELEVGGQRSKSTVTSLESGVALLDAATKQ